MDAHAPPPGALAEHLAGARKALRLSQAEAARRAGVGRMAWYEWETGRRLPRDKNYAGIEEAVEWRSGSVEAVLAGGMPVPLERGSSEVRLDAELRAAWEDFNLRSKSRGAESALKALRVDLDRIESEHERARQMQRSMRDESDAG